MWHNKLMICFKICFSHYWWKPASGELVKFFKINLIDTLTQCKKFCLKLKSENRIRQVSKIWYPPNTGLGPPRGPRTTPGLATPRRRVSGFKFQPWENLGYPSIGWRIWCTLVWQFRVPPPPLDLQGTRYFPVGCLHPSTYDIA